MPGEEELAADLKQEIISEMNIKFDVQDAGKMDDYADAMSKAIAKSITEYFGAASGGGV